MWRYVAGGVAALLMTAAGWLIFGGRAQPDPAIPAFVAAHPAATSAQVEAAPGAALPVADRSREQKRFDRYDKDRDAKITRAEYLEPRRKAFAKLDKDGDGRLSFEEWAVRTTDKFAAADADRSATMTAAEFATTAPKRSTRSACRCPSPAAADD